MSQKDEILSAALATSRYLEVVPEAASVLPPYEDVPSFAEFLSRGGRFTPKYARQVLRDFEPEDGSLALAIFDRLRDEGLPAPPRALRSLPRPARTRTYAVVADAHFGQTPRSRVGEVFEAIESISDAECVVFLGDTLHADTLSGTTTRGTAVQPRRAQADVIFEVTSAVRSLEMYTEIVVGNHDAQGAVWLAATIGQRARLFFADPDFGAGFTHGHISEARYSSMLREAAGRAPVSYIFRGHTHQDLLEYSNAQARWLVTLRSAAPRGEYAKSEGYPAHTPCVHAITMDSSGEMVSWTRRFLPT